ncbi:unnamed protein product [Prunus armeniaca]
MVQGNPGSFNAALQQIQARSQQTTGMMQSKPGIGNADAAAIFSTARARLLVFPSEGKLLASAGHDKKV